MSREHDEFDDEMIAARRSLGVAGVNDDNVGRGRTGTWSGGEGVEEVKAAENLAILPLKNSRKDVAS